MATHEQAQRDDPKPASLFRSPLILALLVLTLLNIGASGWMLYSQHLSAGHREAIATATAAEDVPPPSEPAPPPEQPTLVALDPFIVNLADPSGKRYLKASFELEINTPEGVEELKKKNPQIRDSILLVLSSRSFDDIRSAAGKGALREEIVSELNKTLTASKARHIYFKEFVVQ
jgi:flagellar protein FliL